MASLFDGNKKNIDEERKKKKAAALEAKRKIELAKKVKASLSKIMKVYTHMKGNYIKIDDVEICRDDKGNLMGMVGDLAFVFSSDKKINFYSKPIEDNYYYYYGPLRTDNYQDWYEYDEVIVELGIFKTFNLKKENIQTKTAYVCNEDPLPPTEEQRRKVYKQLRYAQVENELAAMRTSSKKR